MKATGIISGRYIKLQHETDLVDGTQVIIDIRPAMISLEEKRKLIDELCGSWARDSSLDKIFTEIKRHRHSSETREVYFDAAS